MQTAVRRARINVSGAVQGVGFRPHVYRLATALGLAGWVRNTPRGVQIDAEGEPAALAALLDALRAAPAPARVDAIDSDCRAAAGASGFAVVASEPGAGPALPLPDLAVCADCLADIRDPAGRRFDYPFTSCSRCGPRYSIIAGLPYDRARTAMAGFAMCAACAAEYADPADRRFHHQANACPVCGPRCDAARRRRHGAGARLGGAGRRCALPARRRHRGADGHRRLSVAGGCPR